MISDMVLLKELPDSVKNSIEAYIGCISGAMKKEQYVGIISKAGFHGVKIVDENAFPIEGLINDPTVKTIVENLRIPIEQMREVAGSVVSIKVHGVKPRGEYAHPS